jgi:hypothetical protein
MTLRDWGNLALHFTVAAALAALILFNHWFIVLATFIYTWLREQAQHRWVLTLVEAHYTEDRADRLYRVRKSTFFGWMSWWRMFEVAQWTVGSAMACLAYELWSRRG